MLRHLYLAVLRLHPARFRKRFGDEMLSIFEQEQDTLAASRLVLDGLVSLTRQWALRQEFWDETPTSHVAEPASADVPSFVTLDPFHPQSAAVIYGALLSILLFCLTCFAIRYSWIHILHVHIPEVQFEQPQYPPPSSRTGESSREHSISPVNKTQSRALSTVSGPPVTGQPVAPAKATEYPHDVLAPSEKAASTSDEPSRTIPATLALPKTAERTPAPPGADALLDAAARRRVIDGAITNLTRYYIYPAVARKMAESLRRHEQNGDDNEATGGESFADVLTTQLRAVSHDRHLGVVYSQSAIPEGVTGPTQAAITRYRQEMERTNCTLQKVTVLRHNVGYIKLNSFPDLQLCQPTVAAAMASLNQADAIIVDLRDNHGGASGMVAFVASYFFQHPTHLEDFYNRSSNSTLQSWTLSPVDGNSLADKPAFVLTSSGTFSGAEEFAYDLKMLKRATLVGETTAGGAHMVRRRRIDDHFSIGVPDTRPINPVSKTNWEGRGVTPGVNVRASEALKVAESLADKAAQK